MSFADPTLSNIFALVPLFASLTMLMYTIDERTELDGPDGRND